MPIRLSDTQKITNVPSSRDIGSLVNLDTSRDPNVNKPIPPLPRIQSGLATQIEVYELIDRIDFSSNSPIFSVNEILFPLLGKYDRYKIVFEGVDNATAGNQLNLLFNNQTETYYYEWMSEQGTSVSSSSTFTASSAIVVGNSTSFNTGAGGTTGEIDLYFPFLPQLSSYSTIGPYAKWFLINGSYRTMGHGTMLNGTNPVDCIRLTFSYAPVVGRISCFGVPRN